MGGTRPACRTTLNGMRDDLHTKEARPSEATRRAISKPWQARNRLIPRQKVVLPKARPAAHLPKAHVVTEKRYLLRGYIECLRADLYRKTGQRGLRTLAKALFNDAGFKHVFWFRTAIFVRKHRLKPLLYPLVHLIYRHYQQKHGVWLTPATKVGPGLFLEHMGDIVVNGRAVIGKNCNLANGVTIGQTNRGKRKGTPTIGDNVFIGPGAKILGNVRVGNNVAIGANCVVVEDVPDNAVIAAQPGQIISYGGVAGYINNTDYDTA